MKLNATQNALLELLRDWLEAALTTWLILTVERRTVPSGKGKSGRLVPGGGEEALFLKGLVYWERHQRSIKGEVSSYET